MFEMKAAELNYVLVRIIFICLYVVAGFWEIICNSMWTSYKWRIGTCTNEIETELERLV
jgi:hypothetical protein